MGTSISAGTSISWIEQVAQPPFQLVTPIASSLILFGGARDRAPAPLPVQAATSVLKIFGAAPRSPESASSILLLMGGARRVTLPERSLGLLRIFAKAIAYPNMASGESRVRDRSFTAQSNFPLELGSFLRVDWIRIVIWEPFGSGWSLSVGDASNNQFFIIENHFNPSEASPNIIEVNPGYQYTTPTMVYLYQTGNSQVGAGTIYISQG